MKHSKRSEQWMTSFRQQTLVVVLTAPGSAGQLHSVSFLYSFTADWPVRLKLSVAGQLDWSVKSEARARHPIDCLFWTLAEAAAQSNNSECVCGLTLLTSCLTGNTLHNSALPFLFLLPEFTHIHTHFTGECLFLVPFQVTQPPPIHSSSYHTLLANTREHWIILSNETACWIIKPTLKDLHLWKHINFRDHIRCFSALSFQDYKNQTTL